MTTREEIELYCENNGVRLTEPEMLEAIDLVDNQSYTVEAAVNHVDHPIKPTGQ